MPRLVLVYIIVCIYFHFLFDLMNEIKFLFRAEIGPGNAGQRTKSLWSLFAIFRIIFVRSHLFCCILDVFSNKVRSMPSHNYLWSLCPFIDSLLSRQVLASELSSALLTLIRPSIALVKFHLLSFSCEIEHVQSHTMEASPERPKVVIYAVFRGLSCSWRSCSASAF